MSLQEIAETIKPWAVILASVAVPLVVAYFGNSMAAANKESENKVKYVELAVSLLKTDPKPEARALREWAVELLNAHAPVKLSEAAKAQLLERALLSGNVTLDSVSFSGSLQGSPSQK
jgi:hypothetical protein